MPESPESLRRENHALKAALEIATNALEVHALSSTDLALIDPTFCSWHAKDRLAKVRKALGGKGEGTHGD